MSDLRITIKTDTPEAFCILGSTDPDPHYAKWDYAVARVVDGNRIFIDSAAGATLDREHALLFADKLRIMAESLPALAAVKGEGE